MKTLIVIVNYGTPRLTIDCLTSLAGDVEIAGQVQVAVVDNASPDHSVSTIRAAILKQGWSSWISVNEMPRNGGFAYGNNAAIGAALGSENPPEYVWLLNSDTVARPGALSHLIRYLEEHPAAGLVGSRLEDPDGTQQASTFRFPSLASEVDEALQINLVHQLLAKRTILAPVTDQATEVDWVAGASLLVRREVFETVGLLDDRYFLYYEEVDFCRRAARLGWKCGYEPASRVVHLVGRSSGVTVRETPNRRPAYWFDSRQRYFTRHHGRWATAGINTCWSLAYPVGRAYRALRCRPVTDPPWFWIDYLRHRLFARGLAHE